MKIFNRIKSKIKAYSWAKMFLLNLGPSVLYCEKKKKKKNRLFLENNLITEYQQNMV